MARIFGLDKVQLALGKEIRGIEGRTKDGLRRAGILVRREAQKGTPVDTGNLISSYYGPVIQGSGARLRASIGLTASYAPYVHERVGVHFQKPTARAKFLQLAVQENAQQILKIIADSARIRK